MRRITRRTVLTAALGAGVAACSSGKGAPKPGAAGTPAPGTPGSLSPDASPATPAPVLTVDPAGGAQPIAPDRPVTVTATGGRIDNVTVSAGSGRPLRGDLAADGARWTASDPLDFGKTYTVRATAVGSDGQRVDTKAEFTTLTPHNTFAGTYTPDHATTVGVGMPVSVTFNRAIKDKAAVEKRLTVTSEPQVEGSWSWLKDRDGKDRVDWRPREHWPAGAKVRFQMQLLGVDAGDGVYGTQNRDVSFTIGRSLVATVDVVAKTMAIAVDGKPLRTLPVSAGKAEFETWNGTMVVLSKVPSIDMNSETVGIFGVEGYDIKDVKWDVQLTPSGTYVHAAPWNEGKFGKVNGSHGCIGMSTDDAKFYYDQTVPGDLVTVVNSKDTVATNNGFGCWNVPWPDWAAGSALR